MRTGEIEGMLVALKQYLAFVYVGYVLSAQIMDVGVMEVMTKYKIMIEFEDGTIGQVDTAESESESCILIEQQRRLFPHAKRIWAQH